MSNSASAIPLPSTHKPMMMMAQILLEKTQEGKIAWEKMVDGNTYLYVFGGKYSIFLTHIPNETIYSLTMKDRDENILGNYVETVPALIEYFFNKSPFILQQLFQMASQPDFTQKINEAAEILAKL